MFDGGETSARAHPPPTDPPDPRQPPRLCKPAQRIRPRIRPRTRRERERPTSGHRAALSLTIRPRHTPAEHSPKPDTPSVSDRDLPKRRQKTLDTGGRDTHREHTRGAHRHTHRGRQPQPTHTGGRGATGAEPRPTHRGRDPRGTTQGEQPCHTGGAGGEAHAEQAEPHRRNEAELTPRTAPVQEILGEMRRTQALVPQNRAHN